MIFFLVNVKNENHPLVSNFRPHKFPPSFFNVLIIVILSEFFSPSRLSIFDFDDSIQKL